jgi:hypothetical protein
MGLEKQGVGNGCKRVARKGWVESNPYRYLYPISFECFIPTIVRPSYVLLSSLSVSLTLPASSYSNRFRECSCIRSQGWRPGTSIHFLPVFPLIVDEGSDNDGNVNWHQSGPHVGGNSRI